MKSKESIARQGKVPFVVSVSGHRELSDVVDVKANVKKCFVDEIAGNFPETPFVLLSALAEGSDQIAAEIALELGWEVIAVLPMSSQAYEADFVTSEAKHRFKNLLQRCNHVIELEHEGDELDKDRQYSSLGHFLIKHSQLMVLLWDGVESPEKPGGTAWVRRQCLDGVVSERDPLVAERVAYLHIPVQRIQSDLPKPKPSSLATEVWLAVLRHISEFNKTAENCSKKLGQGKAKCIQHLLGSRPYPEFVPPTHSPLVDVYAIADQISINEQKLRKRVVIADLSLVALAVMFQSIYSGPVMAHWALIGYISLLVFAYLLYDGFFAGPLSRALAALSVRNTRHLDQRYLDYRALAEGLRVQIFWKIHGIRDCVADYYLHQHQQEIKWIAYAIRNLCLMQTCQVAQPESTPIATVEYLKKQWVNAQANYFLGPDPLNAGGAAVRHETKANKLSYWSKVFFTLGVVSVFANLLWHLINLPFSWSPAEGDLNSQINYIIVLTTFLFICSGAIKAFAEIMGDEGRALSYHFTGTLYRRAALAIERPGADVSKILVDLGKVALAENAEWLVMHRRQTLKFEDRI